MKRIVVGLLLLVVVLAVAVALGLDAIVRSGIEKGATYALDVKTDVGSVDLGVLAGTATIEKLRIANPAGYSQDVPALAADKIATQVHLKSLFSDEVVVPLVELQAPEVFVEVSAGSTNIGALLANLERKTGGKKPKEPGPSPEPGKKYRVGVLKITGAKVRVGHAALGSQVLALEPIEVRDLDNSPKSMGQLLQVVLAELLRAATKVPGLPGELAQALERDAGAAVGRLREAVEGAAKGVESRIQDAVKGVPGLEDVLKKKKP